MAQSDKLSFIEYLNLKDKDVINLSFHNFYYYNRKLVNLTNGKVYPVQYLTQRCSLAEQLGYPIIIPETNLAPNEKRIVNQLILEGKIVYEEYITQQYTDMVRSGFRTAISIRPRVFILNWKITNNQSYTSYGTVNIYNQNSKMNTVPLTKDFANKFNLIYETN